MKRKHEGDKLDRPYYRGSRKPADKASEIITRVRTPNIGEKEVLGTVVKMLGASHFTIQCLDSVTRMCRLRGKLRKRVWIREGDIVIVVPLGIPGWEGRCYMEIHRAAGQLAPAERIPGNDINLKGRERFVT
jgi:initiation factor 1A